jgi:hypothetical protein
MAIMHPSRATSGLNLLLINQNAFVDSVDEESGQKKAQARMPGLLQN